MAEAISNNSVNIEVNPQTENPDKAWKLIKDSVNHVEIKPLPLDTPIYEDKVNNQYICQIFKNQFSNCIFTGSLRLYFRYSFRRESNGQATSRGCSHSCR